jgi:peptidoglycan/LPS O-acetylase OafA/YrhL
MSERTMIKPLHGLRGMAAVTVIMGHLGPVHAAASIGVVLFFLLSGFLMGRLYLTRPFSGVEVARYAVARFGRVYPMFALIVLLAGAAGLLNSASGTPFNMTRGEIIPHLLLAGHGFTIWTISVEFQFYAVFLLMWFLYGKLPASNVLLALTVVVFTWIGIGPAASAGRIDLWRYLHLFTGGMLMAVALQSGASERVRSISSAAMPLLLIGYGVAFLVFPQVSPVDLIYADPAVVALCAGLIFTAVAAPHSRCGRILSIRPAVWLGEISFGIYLLHRVAAWIVATAWPDIPGPAGFAIEVVLTLACATLLHRYYENPTRVMIRNIGEAALRRSAILPSALPPKLSKQPR